MLRIVWMSVLVAAAASWSACARNSSAFVARDGLLVLELGGDQPSLRAELERRGVALAAPRSWRTVALPEDPVPAAVPVPVPLPMEAGGGADGNQASDAAPAPGPGVPTPAVEPAWFEVRLGRRETLMHLAKKHLGKATRFPELLTLNGWTDEQARRLVEGQIVKIPRQPQGR